MYRCPSCLSQRQKEQLNILKNERHLIISYENGCQLKLKSTGNNWTILLQKCNLYPSSLPESAAQTDSSNCKTSTQNG